VGALLYMYLIHSIYLVTLVTLWREDGTYTEKFRIENCVTVTVQFITALENRLWACELLYLCIYLLNFINEQCQLISSRFGCRRKLDVLSSQDILMTASNLIDVFSDEFYVCLMSLCSWLTERVHIWKTTVCLGKKFHVSV